MMGVSRRPPAATRRDRMALELTADGFLADLWARQSDAELAKIGRYFKSGPGEYAEGDRFIGVRMGEVFALAEAHVGMAITELERLLDSDIHEARAGAVSCMAKTYGKRATSGDQREALFALYLRRHDRINNWDLVDLGAHQIVGAHLSERSRELLYQLSASPVLWERRTAIYATIAFLKRGDLDDCYGIAERLLADPQDLIQKAVGGVLRWAGDKDRQRLDAFLERSAAAMPRTMLRVTVEMHPPEQRAAWLARGARK